MIPTILVVGFNVRPLARSAKKAGYRVLAVDFWGDLDLPDWADTYISVLDQQPQHRPERPTLPTAEALVTGVQQLLEDYGPVDYIITSGGFDDHPDAWSHLSQLGMLLGNSTEGLTRARDRQVTCEIAQQVGAATPKSDEASTAKQLQAATNLLELPILVKPKYGSGGFHSRVLRTEKEITQYIQRHHFTAKTPVLVQELILGTDVSVSVLGSGSTSLAVSTNEQLIGLPELGKGKTKAYCGNIIPLDTNSEIKHQLTGISEEISSKLELIGSNGFDYVIATDGTPYFMEINPRIQATIEALELITNINLVTLHIDACQGRLPQKAPDLNGYCARIIVYAKFTCKVPDLRNIPGVVDIPMPGSIAERGDPICTVNHIGQTRKQALRGAQEIVKTIYNNLRPIKAKKKLNNSK
jgi:predicted ATP-grasp superfamily ATP-dependent carboligase